MKLMDVRNVSDIEKNVYQLQNDEGVIQEYNSQLFHLELNLDYVWYKTFISKRNNDNWTLYQLVPIIDGSARFELARDMHLESECRTIIEQLKEHPKTRLPLLLN